MLTDEQEQKLKEKLAATAKEKAVLEAFAKSGVRMTKATKAYVESAITVHLYGGDSPVFSIADPTSGGRTYASVDQFAEALKGDPDFAPAPATSQSSSSRDGKPAVRHVRQQDLIAERVSPEQIMSGEVVVDMPELVHRENLAADEVSVRDQKALNASLQDIAAGRTRVVFPSRA